MGGQLKKVQSFQAMNAGHLAKFEDANPAGKRALFERSLRAAVAARAHIEQAKEAKDRLVQRGTAVKRKSHAMTGLKETWKAQMAAMERAVVASRDVHNAYKKNKEYEVEELKRQLEVLK